MTVPISHASPEHLNNKKTRKDFLQLVKNLHQVLLSLSSVQQCTIQRMLCRFSLHCHCILTTFLIYITFLPFLSHLYFPLHLYFQYRKHATCNYTGSWVFVLYFKIWARVFLKQNLGTLITVAIREYYLIFLKKLIHLFIFYKSNTKCRSEFLKKKWGVYRSIYVYENYNPWIFRSS